MTHKVFNTYLQWINSQSGWLPTLQIHVSRHSQNTIVLIEKHFTTYMVKTSVISRFPLKDQVPDNCLSNNASHVVLTKLFIRCSSLYCWSIGSIEGNGFNSLFSPDTYTVSTDFAYALQFYNSTPSVALVELTSL